MSDFEDVFVPDRGFCIKGGRIVFGKSAIDCNKLIKEKALEIIQRKTIVVSRDDLVLNKILKTIKCVKNTLFLEGPSEVGLNSTLTGCEL